MPGTRFSLLFEITGIPRLVKAPVDLAGILGSPATNRTVGDG